MKRSKEEAKKAAAELMKEIRIEKGLTQDQLADRLGCNRSAIAHSETDGGISKVETIVEFCNALETDFVEFLTRLAVRLSQGKDTVSLEQIREKLDRGAKELCQREGLQCIVNIVIDSRTLKP